MYKYLFKISTPTLFLCFLLIFAGCEEKSVDRKKPEVFAKKIIIPAKKAPVKKITKTIAEKQIKKKPSIKIAVSKPKTVALKKTSKEKAPVKAPRKMTMASISRTPILTKLSDIVRGYDPRGKIDPFEPLLKPEPQRKTEKKKIERKKCIARTPLQKADLSQFKLVAVIQTKSGNRALVVEPSGKGYVLKQDTAIGIHCGQVIEIMKDSLIVEEEVEDLYGEVTKQKRELKIQKPLGE